MGTRSIRAADYFTLNVYWFALSFLWNSMGPILLPMLILRVAPESQKGGALGMLSALGLVIAMIVQPLAGAWSDTRTTRWGKRRPYIVGGTLADVILLTALLLAPDFVTMLVAYALLQIVSNLAHGPYQAYLPDLVPEAQRGAITGVKQFFEIVGVIATSLVVGNLAGQGQLGWAFGVISACLLGAMLITARWVSEVPFAGAPARPADTRASDATWLGLVFHSRAFTLWLVSRLFILTGGVAVRNYLLYFMQDVLQLENPAAEAGKLFALLAIAVALVVYPAGVLSDRWSRKPLIIASGVLGAIGAGMLVFAQSPTDLGIFGGILGISLGIFLSVNWAWGADLVPAGGSGRLFGVSNLATAGSGVLAGAGGFLLDFFNTPNVNWGYTVLYLSAAACYVIGTILALGVPDRR